MKQHRIQFEILGKPWELRLLKKKKYLKSNGSDSVAITDVNKRRIDIGPNGRDKETIIHELVHAYLGEMCTHSADLDSDSSEEIFCELMAKRGDELLRLADSLLNEVQAPRVLLVPSSSSTILD